MNNVEDIYPLTPAQQGMLFHTLYDPVSGIYVEQLSWIHDGDMDVVAFERAWQEVIKRHAVLRTGFFIEGLNEPLQVVRRQANLSIDQHDWRSLSAAELHERLEAFLKDDRLRGFELAKAPLMRLALFKLSARACRVVWSHHHMLLDGWSTFLILKEVLQFYDAFSQGQTLSLEEAQPYSDYIAWLQRQDLSSAEAFWRGTLKGFTSPTPLVVERLTNNASGEGSRIRWKEYHLSAAATAALQATARRNQLTINTIVQGAWALLLSRYSGEEDVVFGNIVSGRPVDLHASDSIVGLFLNLLPVRAQVDGQALLLGWLRDLQRQQAEARRYEYSPLVDVQRWSEVPVGRALFQTALAFENFPVDDILSHRTGKLEVRDFVRYPSTTNYPISVIVEQQQDLLLQIVYDSDRFDADTIARMLGHFGTLLENMARNPERRLSQFQILTEAERQQLLDYWSHNATHYPLNVSFHGLFQHQVRTRADKLAAVQNENSITFQELNRKASTLAKLINELQK
jgi:hypothetical protein